MFVSVTYARPVHFHKGDQTSIVSSLKNTMSVQSRDQVHMVKRTTSVNINTGNHEAVCPHCNGSGCSACKDGQTRNRPRIKDEESMKGNHQHSHGHSQSVQFARKNINS